jgi:DNA replication protein DnaC
MANMTKDRHVQDGVYDYYVCHKCGGCSTGWTWPLHVSRCKCNERLSFSSESLMRIDPSQYMTFENMTELDPTMAKGVKRGKELAAGEDVKGMFLLGEPGVGKTHLACAIVYAARSNGLIAGYFNVSDLISKIQSTYGKYDGPDTERVIIENVAAHELVVLDDLGKERHSENVAQILYQVIDGMYAKRCRFVVSTNLAPADISTRYDAAIRSRIRDRCDLLQLKGPVRRVEEWNRL